MFVCLYLRNIISEILDIICTYTSLIYSFTLLFGISLHKYGITYLPMYTSQGNNANSCHNLNIIAAKYNRRLFVYHFAIWCGSVCECGVCVSGGEWEVSALCSHSKIYYNLSWGSSIRHLTLKLCLHHPVSREREKGSVEKASLTAGNKTSAHSLRWEIVNSSISMQGDLKICFLFVLRRRKKLLMNP